MAPRTAYKPEVPYTNGVVAMPTKKATIKLDEIGYTGWWCEVRTNPLSEEWDKFLEDSDPEKIWENFKVFILDWNFGDAHGVKIPVSCPRSKLPMDVPAFLINKYVDEINKVQGLPKAPDSSSGGS